MSTKPKAFAGIKDFQPDLISTLGWVCVVDRKHDGDTELVQASVGVNQYPMLWLRTFNVYAAEMDDPGGPEALEAMEELMPDGTLIWAKTYYQTFERWACARRFFGGPMQGRNVAEVALERYPELFEQKGPLIPMSVSQVNKAKARDENELANRSRVR